MKQNISRFEISVNNAVLVSIVQCSSNLLDDGGGLAKGQFTAFGYYIMKRTTCHIWHNEVSKPILFAMLINRHNVDMIECGNSVSFSTKSD